MHLDLEIECLMVLTVMLGQVSQEVKVSTGDHQINSVRLLKKHVFFSVYVDTCIYIYVYI